MILKICPFCQAENPENAVFCKKCGALFRGTPEIRDTVAEKNKRKNKVIIVLCAVLIVIGIGAILFGYSDEPDTALTTTAAPDITTTVPVTPAVTEPSSSQAPTVNATTLATTTSTTAVVATTVPTTAPIPATPEVICAEFNNIVGTLKSCSSDVMVHKTEKIELEITSFSLPVPTEAINSFMTKLIPETDITHSFSSGKSKEDSEITLSAFIPPASKAVPDVTADKLLSAEKDASGTLTLCFRPDSSTFSDGQTVFPLYVGSATDVLDFATFALGPVKIVKADIQYPETKLTAEVNPDGTLKRLTLYQPVTVLSTGGVGSLTADVGMNLMATTTFEITY